MKIVKKFLGIVGVPLLCAAVVFLLFRFVLFLGYVPSASMEPTISAESWILGSRIYRELKRGDIVIFEKDGRYLVKRIVAVPGDTLYIDDSTGKVSVNTEIENVTRILEVPEYSYFMMGDNANVSIDSRYWVEPFINQDQIQASVLSAL